MFGSNCVMSCSVRIVSFSARFELCHLVFELCHLRVELHHLVSGSNCHIVLDSNCVI